MATIVTGSAGFIGFHVCTALLARGEHVIGIDNLNDYYDPALKNARLAQLKNHKNFSFYQADISNKNKTDEIFSSHPQVNQVVHLAAQAGVRYSLENPFAYVSSNLVGHVVILEACRHLKGLKHLVYASSSSVYSGNTDIKFSLDYQCTTPHSLYAATKKADELMTYTYSHLYGTPATALRYFTVYGPWGRPDMAAYLFTDAIINNRPISVFNNGKMKRDFTYIDDIVAGTLAALDRIPNGTPPHATYNLGNNNPEYLLDFINTLEDSIGKKAQIDFKPMQQGDVKETAADISQSTRDLGFYPKTSITQGLPQFVTWYKNYKGVAT